MGQGAAVPSTSISEASTSARGLMSFVIGKVHDGGDTLVLNHAIPIAGIDKACYTWPADDVVVGVQVINTCQVPHTVVAR